MTFRESVLQPRQVEAAKRLNEIFLCRKAEKGVTHRSLAEAGVASEGYISQMLTLRRPIGPEAAARFAAALGVKVDDFSPELADDLRRMADATVSTGDEILPPGVWSALPDEARQKVMVYALDQARLAAAGSAELAQLLARAPLDDRTVEDRMPITRARNQPSE